MAQRREHFIVEGVVFSGEIATGLLKPDKRTLFHLLSRVPETVLVKSPDLDKIKGGLKDGAVVVVHHS